MNVQQTAIYDLRIHPLRPQAELTDAVVRGVKMTLDAMFEDAFSVRDVVIAVREVVDNIATHTNWNHPSKPSLHIWYEILGTKPKFSVYATNAVKDRDEVTRKVSAICKMSQEEAIAQLGRKMVSDSGFGERGSGGIGLLQLVSSPRCYLSTRLDGDVFSIQVNVNVPELRPAVAAVG